MRNMVIRGGENVYPRDIEEYLYTHPKISEVQMFGVPDENFGEEIAYYKFPRFIRFVKESP